MKPTMQKSLVALDAFVVPQAPAPPPNAPTQAGTPPPPPPEASTFSNGSQAAGGPPPASGSTPQPPPPQSGPSWNQWAGGQLPPPPNPTQPCSSLPPFDTYDETWVDEIITPPELVKGLIHSGTKVALVGGSKANKTWSLMDLAFSIAHGIPWWGLPTTQGRVLYINLEISPPFARKRLRQIQLTKMPAGGSHRGDLMLWNLRGHILELAVMIQEITRRIATERFSVIIIDPVYKLLGDRDENGAGDIAGMLNELEKLVVNSGAAVIFGAHTTKGNQAGKEPMDRASGSGVFARDPDTMIILTAHEEADAFTVDFVLRNFPPMPAFVVRREHPLMVRAEDLAPEDLKQPRNGKRAPKPVPTLEMFMDLFPKIQKEDLAKSSLGNPEISAIFKERGWDLGSIKSLKEDAQKKGRLKMDTRAHNRQFFIRAEVLSQFESGSF
jgi:hypothetical protein